MPKLKPQVEQQFRDNPGQSFELIVRTEGEVAGRVAWLEAAGLRVRQQYRLSPGAAVSGTGSDALKLLDQPWVVSIELDAPVQAV